MLYLVGLKNLSEASLTYSQKLRNFHVGNFLFPLQSIIDKHR